MKAWNDLESDPNISLYWTGDRENPKSYWYLDHGVKIEKFANGDIQLWNAMMAGDFYKKIPKHLISIFETEGWLAGCYEVCINLYQYRILNVIDLIKKYPFDKDLLNRKENIEKKLKRYLELKDNLLHS